MALVKLRRHSLKKMRCTLWNSRRASPWVFLGLSGLEKINHKRRQAGCTTKNHGSWAFEVSKHAIFTHFHSSNLLRKVSSLDTAILEKCYQCHLSIELRLFNFLQRHGPWSPWTKPSFEKPRHPWWPAVPSSNDTANWGQKKCKWGREWNPTTWEQTHL